MMRTDLILFFSLAAVLMSAGACQRQDPVWTKAESQLIAEGTARLEQNGNARAPMRVLTIDDKDDSLFLRTPCTELGAKAVASPEYALLERLMVATVTSPEEDGVGIAGPQVGIGRRMVAVQRFDKEGEPFEVYPDIRITERRGEQVAGPEGCLSVPGRRGDVLRWRDIDITYLSPKTLKDTTERIQGFTAVIFQHETDHLDGVLYTDRI